MRALSLLLAAAASALDITGTISIPTAPLRAPRASDAVAALGAAPDASSLRVLLDGGAAVAQPSADGAFSFPGVAPGVHSVEVFHADLLFPRFTVDVAADGALASAAEHKYPGAPRLAAALPLEVAPVVQAQHWEERPPNQLWGMLRSPMVLMGGGMLLLMMCVCRPPTPVNTCAA